MKKRVRRIGTSMGAKCEEAWRTLAVVNKCRATIEHPVLQRRFRLRTCLIQDDRPTTRFLHTQVNQVDDLLLGIRAWAILDLPLFGSHPAFQIPFSFGLWTRSHGQTEVKTVKS